MQFETLESRTLLAADFAAISGVVSLDAGGGGNQIAGLVMTLHLDNGDGVFNPATDAFLASTTTASDGRYRFDALTAGNYFVRQQSIHIGLVTLPAVTSDLISITPNDAEGTMHTIIDSFDVTRQIAKANSSLPYAASTAFASEALGGYRKLLVTLDQPFGTVAMMANDPDSGMARLDFSATATATGSRRVTWDGTGNAADSTNFTGLGGVDLTHGGMNTGIATVVNADKVGEVTIRLYSDAINHSTAIIPLPNTMGGLARVFVPFTSFLATAGAGATLTNLGAIRIDVDADSVAADGYIEAIGAVGPTVMTFDFTNEVIHLELTKTVDSPRPQVNSNVRFSVTVTNRGAMDATGVQVLDYLPTGLRFVSAQATQGSYNSFNGIWNVGTIAQGASQTLTLVATVMSPGVKTNIAQVWAADQADIDSIPRNGDPTEDDQASVSVIPRVIDLSLTKTVDDARPNVGQDVTFTIIVRNDGPDGATGVRVLDQLPAGLTLKSATPAVGTYNNVSGIWHVGSLPAGGSTAMSIVATVASLGTKRNTAQVWTANEFDIDSIPGNGNPTEDDQASVTVTPRLIDLSLTKVVDTPTPLVGEAVTFTVTVTNSGPDTATGVSVLDVLPAGLILQSSVTSVGSYNSLNGLWILGSLANGQSETLVMTALVTKQRTMVNTAQVYTANEHDIDSTPGNDDPSEDDQASVVIEPRISPPISTGGFPTPLPGRFSKLRFLAR